MAGDGSERNAEFSKQVPRLMSHTNIPPPLWQLLNQDPNRWAETHVKLVTHSNTPEPEVTHPSFCVPEIAARGYVNCVPSILVQYIVRRAQRQ
jgi:hypothetical protein